MRVGILEKLPILHTGRFGHFRLSSTSSLGVTSRTCTKALFSENSVWVRFQNIKYFESDYIALLSDNRANEVASCRY